MWDKHPKWICRWMVTALFCVSAQVAIGEDLAPAPVTDDSEAVTTTAETAPPIDADELLDLSLEELMNIEVISTSRSRGQSLFTSPAAIFVITQEDIQRSGHKHLPELLRMVPGVHVARIDANKWSVAPRGFSQRFNGTLLVQVDGRTLYTPGFSGVIWTIQDTPLQDIDRIEVVRGPGASLWGSNAVNGIINIVTKSARDTQGAYLEIGTGTHEELFGTIRYGDAIGDAGAFRVYAKGNLHDCFETVGPAYSDDWRRGQAGFRMDFEANGDTFTLQGDIYQVEAGESIKNVDVPAGMIFDRNREHEYRGANLLGRWTRTFSDTSEMKFQAYLDWTDWRVPFDDGQFAQSIYQVDLDFQHTFSPAERHSIVWGLGYRHTVADYDLAGLLNASADSFSLDLFTAFIQDTMTLVDDRLDFSIGTKIEHNEFTGFEFQPSARLVWTPDDRNTVWGAVSRAMRVPSIVEDVGQILLGAPAPGVSSTLFGNRALKAEELIAYELGYRVRVCDQLVIDLAGFYNSYEDIAMFEPISLTDVQYMSSQSGETYGLETVATWSPVQALTLRGTWSLLDVQLRGDGIVGEGDSPSNMLSLIAYYDVVEDVELNAGLYWVDELPSLGIESYTRFDVGLRWHINPSTTLSIYGQNLFDNTHQEFPADGFLSRSAAEIERSVYGQVSIEF